MKLNDITVETVVKGLLTQGYKEVGGSDVFRILRRDDGQQVKVFHDDYNTKVNIIVRESVEAQEGD